MKRGVVVLNKIQEDHEFIVTRTASVIALHRLHTDPTQWYHSQSGFSLPIQPIALSIGGPAMPQAYPTHKNIQNQNSNNNKVIKGTNTTIIPSLKHRENVNIDRM
jgi:hypothetical protein